MESPLGNTNIIFRKLKIFSLPFLTRFEFKLDPSNVLLLALNLSFIKASSLFRLKLEAKREF